MRVGRHIAWLHADLPYTAIISIDCLDTGATLTSFPIYISYTSRQDVSIARTPSGVALLVSASRHVLSTAFLDSLRRFHLL